MNKNNSKFFFNPISDPNQIIRETQNFTQINKNLKPLLLVGCKAADVALKQNEINQLARYQITLQAPYCMLTNGINHIVMKLEGEKVTFLLELPSYQEI